MAVRGGSRVRARVADQKDGTYLCTYKPSVSGKYSIAVSIFGVSLPGSPFALEVFSPQPDAEQCSVSGAALTTIVARTPHAFDIKFRDHMGLTTKAEDLDVFVERLGEAPSADKSVSGTATASEEIAPREAATATSPGSEYNVADESNLSGFESAGEDRVNIALTATSRTSGKSRPAKGKSFLRQRVEVGHRPLVVRAGFDVSSPLYGKLTPGTMVVVQEEQTTAEGDVRARIALIEDTEGMEQVAEGWWRPFNGRQEFKDVLESTLPKLMMDASLATLDTGDTSKQRSVRFPSESAERAKADADVAGASPTKGVGIATESPSRRGGKRSQRKSARRMNSSREGATTIRNRNDLRGAGWITIVKGDQALVRKREKLAAGQRQVHLQQWDRRQRTDKTVAAALNASNANASRDTGKKSRKQLALDKATASQKNVFAQELIDDVGFAYGGVDPGILKSKGQLHDVHKVTYSVGRAGQYLLHVQLRNQALPLPGSPFKLLVKPDKPHAPSTYLSSEFLPLKGIVGTKEADGCHIKLCCRDKMGNSCDEGGAEVEVSCSNADVKTGCIDNGDGSYSLFWRSTSTGISEASIMIHGLHINGSPTQVQLTSNQPDVSKAELRGDGLTTANAGKDAHFVVTFHDWYDNVAQPGPELRVGMALVSEAVLKTGGQPDVNALEPHSCKTSWVKEGHLQVSYIATIAGGNHLFVWCDHEGKDGREPLPGSPFLLSVFSGKGNLSNSEVIGHTRDAEAAEKPGGKHNARLLDDYISNPASLISGDCVLIRPKILDEFGNPSKLPEDALTVYHQLPDGSRESILVQPQTRGGLTTYDIRDTPQLAGTHEAHVLLYSKPIKGSPVQYYVRPDYHEASMSVLARPALPEDSAEHWYTEEEYIVKLTLRDRFGNTCDRGGATIAARMNYLKQGVHDSTSLTPTNHSCTVDDNGDGTYSIRVRLDMGSSERALFPAAINVEINLDKDPKERPTGINLPPVALSFVRNPATETSMQVLSRAGKMVQNANTAIKVMSSSLSKPVAQLPPEVLDPDAPPEVTAAAKGKTRFSMSN